MCGAGDVGPWRRTAVNRRPIARIRTPKSKKPTQPSLLVQGKYDAVWKSSKIAPRPHRVSQSRLPCDGCIQISMASEGGALAANVFHVAAVRDDNMGTRPGLCPNSSTLGYQCLNLDCQHCLAGRLPLGPPVVVPVVEEDEAAVVAETTPQLLYVPRSARRLSTTDMWHSSAKRLG